MQRQCCIGEAGCRCTLPARGGCVLASQRLRGLSHMATAGGGAGGETQVGPAASFFFLGLVLGFYFL